MNRLKKKVQALELLIHLVKTLIIQYILIIEQVFGFVLRMLASDILVVASSIGHRP